jgi:hypothetical protein
MRLEERIHLGLDAEANIKIHPGIPPSTTPSHILALPFDHVSSHGRLKRRVPANAEATSLKRSMTRAERLAGALPWPYSVTSFGLHSPQLQRNNLTPG